jgi:hypothetical protein
MRWCAPTMPGIRPTGWSPPVGMDEMLGIHSTE